MCGSKESETTIGEIVNNNNINQSGENSNSGVYEWVIIIIVSVIVCKLMDYIKNKIENKINQYIISRRQSIRHNRTPTGNQPLNI
jgi:hypothetical protein